MTHTVPSQLVILNPNLKYNSVIIDRVMKNHDPDLQQPERNQKNLKRRKIMKKIIWDEIAAHLDRHHVTAVEKIQRSRKSREEDQKKEVRNRKTRNQVEESRDQVKDRKRMNEVMTQQAAVQVQMIGKIHLTTKKIQVWIFYYFPI